MPVADLHTAVLERIFTLAAFDDELWGAPDYATLKVCALVHSTWRHPAQAILARHIRIASPEAMAAVRSRECRRVLADHQTLVLDSTHQKGADTYWLLDRFTKLNAFRLEYDPLRGQLDGQGERDHEWLTWDVLRHPSLARVVKLAVVADLQDPDDKSLLSLPLTHAILGRLPYEHSVALHKAVFTGCRATLRDISLDFRSQDVEKAALDSLIEEFQTVAATVEHLHFLNKPNINFLMSLHSKMNATKMPYFFSCSYPLLPNALAPFNILALAVVNNGTSLVEFALVEPPSLERASDEHHEALILRYLAAFGSRLDSFNMMARKFRFRFPREWSARFVKLPEIARFLDRAGARGCDVWCGADQKFESSAKALEKRKGKRVAIASNNDHDEAAVDDASPSAIPTFAQVQQVLRLMTASGGAAAAAHAKASAARAQPAPPLGFAVAPSPSITKVSLFSSKARKCLESAALLDHSQLLRDSHAWQLGQIASLGLGGELTAMTYDPVQSLLAVGTEHGKLVVLGAPGVQLAWDLGMPTKIRHLAFKSGSGFLCVVDAKNTLSVFDLQRIEQGKPHRDSSLSLRANVTRVMCLETSASHSFLFIGGKDGTVDLYDIDRGILAAHARIPNLWLAQEEILRRSGVPGAPSRRHIPVCTDVKIHPLDLNLVLVAYEGGVALWNLATRAVEHSYEFVVPPGAPGGGNSTQEDLFTERRSPVTCLAWRPDGMLFAAGHEDGTISFASSEDEMPVMIRTLERADVNKTTEEDLWGWTGQGQAGQRQPANREPIFRLAWSGFPAESWFSASVGKNPFAGAHASPELPASPSLADEKTDLHGGTMLTVMGGVLPHDPVGIHVLEFAAYVARPAAAGKPGGLPLAIREALRESIVPVAHHLYPTPAPPEDFLLLPRDSPHYGLAHDPIAILITSGRDSRCAVLPAAHAANNIEAFSFPPSTLRVPRSLTLPAALSFSGRGTCSTAQMVTTSSLSYRHLVHQFDVSEETAERLPLHGGHAFPVARATRRGPPPTLSDQPPRLLMTSHVDLTIRFWDVSTILLWGRKPPEPEAQPHIEHEFPRPLKHLDVDLKAALADPRASSMAAARLWKERPWELEIDKVSFGEENLELAVSLSTGDLLVWRFAYGEHPQALELDRVEASAELEQTVQGALRDLSLGGPSATPPVPRGNSSSHAADPAHEAAPQRRRFGSIAHHGRSRGNSTVNGAHQPELDPQDRHIDLAEAVVPRPDLDGFRPVAGFHFSSPASASGVKARSCLALSSVGFLAASSEANLIVIDMRGPDVVLVDVPGSRSSNRGKSKVDSSAITVLSWAICATGEDHDRSPRLIATQASGLTRIFELSNVGGSWYLSENCVSVQHESTRGAFATFVLDKAGNELVANAQNLQVALTHQAALGTVDSYDPAGSITSLWITVNQTTLACYFNVDGPRTAVYEDEHAQFEAAVVVHAQGCSALVVQSRNCMLSMFSLPDLTYIARAKFDTTLHDSAGVFSLAPDGDYVQYLDALNIRLGTLRDLYRPAFPPRVIAFDPTIPVPAQTSALQAVGSVVGAWFGGKRVYTGAEVDAILGGPQRPPPKSRPAPGAPPPIIVATKKAKAAPGYGPPSTAFVQGATDSARSIMASTNAALEQRGEYLNALQERLGGMANDAAKFASETKKTAQAEAAKRTIATGWSSLLNKLP